MIFKKPSWIPKNVLRQYLSRTKLDNLFLIDNCKVSSYIVNTLKLGSPVKGFKNIKGIGTYRVLDVLVHAQIRSKKITQTKVQTLEKSVAFLEHRKSILSAELEPLIRRHKEHEARLILDSISMDLTNRTLLSELEITNASLEYVPLCGIYFLIQGDEICYVGQSTNIHVRLVTHTKDKQFTAYSYVLCSKEILDKLESIYIHLFRPKYNGNGNKHQLIAAPINLENLLSCK